MDCRGLPLTNGVKMKDITYINTYIDDFLQVEMCGDTCCLAIHNSMTGERESYVTMDADDCQRLADTLNIAAEKLTKKVAK